MPSEVTDAETDRSTPADSVDRPDGRDPDLPGLLWAVYTSHRVVVTLEGPIRLAVQVRRCRDADCPRYRSPLRAEQEGRLALPQHEFGLDIIALVGRLRHAEHRSVPEVHAELVRRGVVICPRSVGNLLARYDELLALSLTDPTRIGRLTEPAGRVILAIDGLQPDVGHEVLCVVRDVLTGAVLLARSLLSGTRDDLAGLLGEVKHALCVPVAGVVSDGQRSLVQAIAETFPGVPHQRCQFHYLREAARPIYGADRHAKVTLRAHVRGVRPIERSLEGRDDPEAAAARGYCAARRHFADPHGDYRTERDRPLLRRDRHDRLHRQRRAHVPRIADTAQRRDEVLARGRKRHRRRPDGHRERAEPGGGGDSATVFQGAADSAAHLVLRRRRPDRRGRTLLQTAPRPLTEQSARRPFRLPCRHPVSRMLVQVGAIRVAVIRHPAIAQVVSHTPRTPMRPQRTAPPGRLHAILLLLPGLALAAGGARGADDDFKVARGQLTFDAEGTEGGAFHSRKPHVPTDSSGLTIGRGYDMKERTAEQVVKHLTVAGLTEADAKLYAGGAKLSGAKAREYIKASKLPEITAAQQKKLFETSYVEAEADVRRICEKDDVVKKYGKTDWDKLSPAIKDILVDLRFRGDYTPKSREEVQKLVAANDLAGLAKVIADKEKWPGVPDDRFKRRRQYAESAAKGK